MHKTTPNGEVESFANFVERDRKRIAEESQEDADVEDLDDAWEQ
jgi:hypothetical protein